MRNDLIDASCKCWKPHGSVLFMAPRCHGRSVDPASGFHDVTSCDIDVIE